MTNAWFTSTFASSASLKICNYPIVELALKYIFHVKFLCAVYLRKKIPLKLLSYYAVISSVVVEKSTLLKISRIKIILLSFYFFY